MPIMWLQDTGILKKLYEDELNAPWKIPLPQVKIEEAITISQLATAFMLAVLGISVSIIIFLIEVFVGRGKNKNSELHSDSKKATRLPQELPNIEI